VGYLDDVKGFVEAIAQTTVDELLQQKNYVALSGHALAVNTFKPAMDLLMPEIKADQSKKRDAITLNLRNRYYNERLLELGNYIGGLNKKTAAYQSNVARLQQELTVAKAAPHEALEEFDASGLDFQMGMEVLERNQAVQAREMRQYLIPGEINKALQVLKTHLAEVETWAEELARCAKAQREGGVGLSSLPRQKQQQYNAELTIQLQTFDTEFAAALLAVHGLSYDVFLTVLEEKLKITDAFDEKPQLLQMVEQLKLLLGAQRAEQEARAVLKHASDKHEKNIEALTAQNKKLADNSERVIPGLQVAIKQGEDALPGYRLEINTYRAKKWLYWSLAALAVAAITLPVVTLVFGLSEVAFLLSLPLAFVSFFGSCWFLAAGANNRDKEVTSRGIVKTHTVGIAQNKTEQQKAEQAVADLRQSIPHASDACEATHLSKQAQAAVVDACFAQTQGYYQQAKQFGIFKPDGEDHVVDLSKGQIVNGL
jgi:hypothetical protein